MLPSTYARPVGHGHPGPACRLSPKWGCIASNGPPVAGAPRSTRPATGEIAPGPRLVLAAATARDQLSAASSAFEAIEVAEGPNSAVSAARSPIEGMRQGAVSAGITTNTGAICSAIRKSLPSKISAAAALNRIAASGREKAEVIRRRSPCAAAVPNAPKSGRTLASRGASGSLGSVAKTAVDA